MSDSKPSVAKAVPEEILARNPNTGEVLGSVRAHSEADVRAAVARARLAQREWGARSLRERLRILKPIQEGFVDQADEIAALVSQETGKGETVALVADVFLVLTSLAGYARLAPRALRPRRLRHGVVHITKRTYVVQEPLGVVGIISPFNFPILMSMQSTFAALIAGNAVVHKPSELTPLTALKVQELLYQSDLPEGIFQVVIGSAETGQALVHAGVDHIAFIGSSQTGRKVGGAAGQQLIPVTLELGGNNAMIVCDDAQIERAVDAALTFAFAMSGQMCGAVSRLFVQEAIAQKFTDRLRSRVSNLRTTTDTRPGAGEVTALSDEVFLTHVEQHVQEALQSGAQALIGGGRLEGISAPVFKPTLLVDTHPDMRVMQEETFGPVLCVTKFSSDRQAVEMANDTVHGLTASVWSKDRERAWKVAQELQVGTVAVNDHLWPFFAPDVPWGGVKASGLGRVGGEWGLLAMTNPKVISYDRLDLRREFYWLPDSVQVHRIFQHLIPLLYSQRWAKRLAALGRLVGTLVQGLGKGR